MEGAGPHWITSTALAARCAAEAEEKQKQKRERKRGRRESTKRQPRLSQAVGNRGRGLLTDHLRSDR